MIRYFSNRKTLVGPMSSCTRQYFLLYQVQCRVTIDSAFCCTRSNVELQSTVLSVVPGPMSSYNRQYFLLYQVQCRVQSTVLSVVPGPMSSYNRQCFLLYLVIYRAHIDTLFYDDIRWFYLSCCHLVAACKLWISETFFKINLDQTAEIHKKNLDRKH